MENTTYFKNRRQLLGERYSRSLFVIPSGTQAMRSHSVGYRYKTPSDFFYLTGLEMADAILIVAGQKSYLLREAADSLKQLWGDEEVLSAKSLATLSDVQLAERSQLEEIIRSHAMDIDRVALPLGRDVQLEQQILSLLSHSRRLRGRFEGAPLMLCDSRTLVGSLRLVKDTQEIESMRQAARRSSLVHTELMKQSFVGKTEKEICVWIESEFLKQGMLWTAYETIVGAGIRSTVLHARASNKIVQQGELILVDAGGEWQGYCADITRVIPAGKKFSSEQREVYQKVLDVQKSVIQAVRPGQTLQGLHEMVTEVFGEFFRMPHMTSHWIGLDVHDPSAYVDDNGKAILLVAGMCFTVEPGIYLPERGFGIRIEDDILVTATGSEVLSVAPKEVDEIEFIKTMV